MKSRIEKLIALGENQQLDFKFEINDSRKIARSLVAFANTDGGTLLVGVKDNGRIAGIRSEEEFYMVQAAAQIYCKPQIYFESKSIIIAKKTILEINISKGEEKPYLAQDEQGKWVAYIRKHDQNLLANKVQTEVWRQQKLQKRVIIKYTEKEKILFDYLKEKNSISLSKFCNIAHIPRQLAIQILVDLILIKILYIEYDVQTITYHFNKDLKSIDEINSAINKSLGTS